MAKAGTQKPKIDRLTPEQAADLAVYLEECRSRALLTRRADDVTMRSSVQRLYAADKRPIPIVVVLDSPFACLLARAMIRRFVKHGQLRDQLRGQLWDQLGGQLRDQLRDQLGDQLWGQLWGQLRDQLWDQLGDQLKDDDHQPTWFAGGSEWYWIAVYQFAQRIGVKYSHSQSDWLAAWADYADNCGALYPYDGLAFVSRRPSVLTFDARRQLHSEIGPAMAFVDGFAVHAWHGTRVPALWIEDKANLTAKEVLAANDGNVRAAGIAILGWSRLVDQLDAKVVDRHPEGAAGGELLAVSKAKIAPGATGTMKLLRAECPRNGTICFRVPDEIATAHAAQAWARGLPPELFQLPAIRK